MPLAALSTTLTRFLHSEAVGGVLLIVGAIVALIIANSPLGPAFAHLLHTPLGFVAGELDLRLSLAHWVNDGLMVLFFLLVGLEIKRELLVGELSSREKLTLPLAAAIGGMIAPALVYLSVTALLGGATRGWAIPTATDIAFSLAVLRMLGERVPAALTVFLTALAIIDDLGAILVIATFYTAQISLPALGVAGATLGALCILHRLGFQRLAPYLAFGVILWLAILTSGVHATIAGVLLAFTIPLNRALQEVNHCPLHRLEHYLHTPVALIILPIFALANSGIDLSSVSPAVLVDGCTLGIALGLVLGKPLGVFLTSWLCVQAKFGVLPADVRWGHIFGVACLTGIGFTMSLFIGALAFTDGSGDASVRLGVIGGSLVSAALGWFALRRASA